MWAHSSEPKFESIDPGGEVVGVPLGDGLLDRRLPVAEFTCSGVRSDRVRTNPRGMERSVDISRAAGRPFGSLVPVLDGAPWGEVDLSSTENGAEIDKGLRDSDLGIGTYYDPEGKVTILLRVGDRTFGRPIPGALALDPATEAAPPPRKRPGRRPERAKP